MMSDAVRIAVGFCGVFLFCLSAMNELDAQIVGIVCGTALALIAFDPGRHKR